MSQIEQALGRLYQSLEHLEQAATVQERTIESLQQDMFIDRPAAVSNGNGQIQIDPSLLRDKLDRTIGKIEQMLQES